MKQKQALPTKMYTGRVAHAPKLYENKTEEHEKRQLQTSGSRNTKTAKLQEAPKYTKCDFMPYPAKSVICAEMASLRHVMATASKRTRVKGKNKG